MNTRSSKALSAVLDELDSAGASYEVVRSKHFKVRWQLGSRKGVVVCSTTSGRNAPNCAIRDIRRQLRGGAPLRDRTCERTAR